MTVTTQMHALVEALPDEAAQEALDYLRWLAAENDGLSDAELEGVRAGEEEIAHGEFVTLADLK